MRTDGHRRVPFRFLILDFGTELLQGIDQVADGTLAHAFLTGEAESATAESQCRAERTHRRPGISQVKFGLLLARCIRGGIDRAAVAVDGRFRKIFRKFDFHAQLLERFAHVARVIAPEQVVQPCRSAGQRRNQEGAIRDALGTGDADDAAKRLRRRQQLVRGTELKIFHASKL